jgi:hypothetical protein
MKKKMRGEQPASVVELASEECSIDELTYAPGHPYWDWRPSLWALERSQTLQEYHERLAELILHAHLFSYEERVFFAEIAGNPWKPPRKAKDAGVYQAIFSDYYSSYIAAGKVPPKRAVVLKEIMRRFGKTEGGAGKAYDLAIRYLGEPPPTKSRGDKAEKI